MTRDTIEHNDLQGGHMLVQSCSTGDRYYTRAQHWLVCDLIKEGLYKEMVQVPFERTNLVFIEDKMGKTIIIGSLNINTVNVSTYNTATIDEYRLNFHHKFTMNPQSNLDLVVVQDLTFTNPIGLNKHQAYPIAGSGGGTTHTRRWYHPKTVSQIVSDDDIIGLSDGGEDMMMS
ncbi:hypothetical protein C4D60_Mb06t19870 [Musa balbisiana]|uniref:Pectinesterase catalytic domain-containing protein n=1 Tax=Musa balbisiana TaxID=52838 RepID=A0A4S8IPD5_MUSBA|nr:hypothetical protein C4D60_Mb06t19870 [Musa balbisiana]